MSDSDLPDFDEQDLAEAFDEDNTGSFDGAGDGSEMNTLEEMPDVYDVTRALGDADVDEVHAERDADEIADEELADIDLEYDDEAEDDQLDDALEDVPEDAEAFLDDDDNEEVDGLDDLEDDEVEVDYVEDVDQTTSNSGRVAQHFESRGELSDEDVEELGYKEGGDE